MTVTQKAKYLVIDTETTGLFDFKLPADAEGQPRMASVAFVYADEQGRKLNVEKHYIRPDGWTMAAEASRVNGLTTEFLEKNGIAAEEVLDRYTQAIHDGLIIVAYNAQFDTKVLRAELRRADFDDLFEKTPNICVMKPMTNLCKIPGRFGFKWPKLEEALRYLNIVNPNPHDALADAEGACFVLEALIGREMLPEPAVHYAKKDHPARTPAAKRAQAKPAQHFPF